ncbi:MAG: DJ-1/PfpI family protein [Rhodospirillaceae bacterium]|nr:DJ-1/PfpI family protein [Rhodospirillaceae bacterium]
MPDGLNIAILIFDGAEELDYVGPWEVFTMVNLVKRIKKQEPDAHVYFVSESGGKITSAKGMRVEADYSYATAPLADIVLVPGGQGTRREVTNPATLQWVAAQAAGCKWVTSVCTGSMVLAAAGPAKGKTITTHWMAVEEVRARGDAGAVVTGQRWVVDGNVVTSAGVSAGIDMALWVVQQVYGADFCQIVVNAMEYDPAPPVRFSPRKS